MFPNPSLCPEIQTYWHDKLGRMSTSQIKDEISTLEAIRSIFLRAAEKKEAEDSNRNPIPLPVHAEQEEVADRMRKRRFDLLREVPTRGSWRTLEALESCDLETLEELEAHLRKKSRLAIHIRILDEICLDKILDDIKKKSTALHAELLDDIANANGAKAIASKARELAIESLIGSRQLTAAQVHKAWVQERMKLRLEWAKRQKLHGAAAARLES